MGWPIQGVLIKLQSCQGQQLIFQTGQWPPAVGFDNAGPLCRSCRFAVHGRLRAHLPCMFRLQPKLGSLACPWFMWCQAEQPLQHHDLACMACKHKTQGEWMSATAAVSLQIMVWRRVRRLTQASPIRPGRCTLHHLFFHLTGAAARGAAEGMSYASPWMPWMACMRAVLAWTSWRV